VIEVRHVALPPGLSVLALRDPGGDLTLFVSDTLGPDRQRAAIKVALRASRRAKWEPTVIPGLAAAAAICGRTWFGGLLRALRAHSVVVTAATAATVAAAAASLALVPHHGSQLAPGATGQPGQAQRSAHGGSHGAGPHGSGAAHHGTSPHSGSTGQSGQAGPSPNPTASLVSGSPAPSSTPKRHTQAPSPSPTQRSPSSTPTPIPKHSASPTPTPTPSRGSGNGGDTCVKVLGITVCL